MPVAFAEEADTFTRGEAFAMIKRAFGELPTPTGHNARVAYAPQEFTDIPAWAEAELLHWVKMLPTTVHSLALQK